MVHREERRSHDDRGFRVFPGDPACFRRPDQVAMKDVDPMLELEVLRLVYTNLCLELVRSGVSEQRIEALINSCVVHAKKAADRD